MNKLNRVSLAAFAALVGIACNADADVISNTFSQGFGYVQVGGSNAWNTSETASANTDIAGDFTLTVNATSIAFSGDGTTFGGRVLGNGAPGGGNRCGSSSSLGVTVTANYTGGLSGGAIKLVIDSISIYAGNYDLVAGGGYGDDEIYWTETTAGNTGASAALNLGPASGVVSGLAPHLFAVNYDQLAWNPDDVAVAGASSARTFSLGHNGFTAAYIEGLEVVGHVEYVVPEPMTMGLLSVGGLFGLLKRRKQ